MRKTLQTSAYAIVAAVIILLCYGALVWLFTVSHSSLPAIGKLLPGSHGVIYSVPGSSKATVYVRGTVLNFNPTANPTGDQAWYQVIIARNYKVTKATKDGYVIAYQTTSGVPGEAPCYTFTIKPPHGKIAIDVPEAVVSGKLAYADWLNGAIPDLLMLKQYLIRVSAQWSEDGQPADNRYIANQINKIIEELNKPHPDFVPNREGRPIAIPSGA